MRDRVVPIHAEAHTLPFAGGFFDAIVSVDAYQYFGRADLYLGYLTGFLRAGGQLGVVVPAMLAQLGSDVPSELAPFWDWEFCCFHGPDWWRTHWNKSHKVDVDHADAIEDGWKDWLRFNDATEPFVPDWLKQAAADGGAMLRADQGKHLGLTRIVATKRPE